MENKIILVIAVILLCGSTFLAGQSFAKTETIIAYQEKVQPMLLVEIIEWGENIEDSSEVLFDYFVNNFGNVEAKNVVVVCEIQDDNENILKKQSFNIGNVASNSYEWQESTMDYHIMDMDNVYGTCVLESADGDYINLYDRLDELK